MTAFEEIAAAICKSAVDLGRRTEMHAPFVRGGWRYATDACVAVREQTTAADTPNSLPDRMLSSLHWGVFADDGHPLPQPPDVEWEPCENCVDGIETPKCDVCGGTGTVECEYDYEHECPECNGGKNKAPPHTCKDCNGTGRVEKLASLPVGDSGLCISNRYARLLARHGIDRLWTTGKTNSDPFAFRGDGFEGLVMPRAKDTADG